MIALAGDNNPLAFELTTEEAEAWYRGRDIYPQALPAGDEAIVTFQGQALGLAKKVGSRLKNSYPRELVRDGQLFRRQGVTQRIKTHFLTGDFPAVVPG